MKHKLLMRGVLEYIIAQEFHEFYVWDKSNINTCIERFEINPLDYVKDQEIKNDDVIVIFED